jgi:hypothetical protein
MNDALSRLWDSHWSWHSRRKREFYERALETRHTVVAVLADKRYAKLVPFLRVQAAFKPVLTSS